MNFDHMPELRWEFGYPAVLLVIAGHLPVPVPPLQARRLACVTTGLPSSLGEEIASAQRARPIARTLPVIPALPASARC